MIPTVLEQASAHIIIGEADLNSNVILKTFCEHELTCSFQVCQCLIVVFGLPEDGCSKEKEPSHIVEEIETL